MFFVQDGAGDLTVLLYEGLSRNGTRMNSTPLANGYLQRYSCHKAGGSFLLVAMRQLAPVLLTWLNQCIHPCSAVKGKAITMRDAK